MLAETEAKIATAVAAEKERLQQRAQVLREWLTPKSTNRLST
jgi:DNA-binding TFAR19-related protein (PDSD5 family)